MYLPAPGGCTTVHSPNQEQSKKGEDGQEEKDQDVPRRPVLGLPISAFPGLTLPSKGHPSLLGPGQWTLLRGRCSSTVIAKIRGPRMHEGVRRTRRQPA